MSVSQSVIQSVSQSVRPSQGIFQLCASRGGAARSRLVAPLSVFKLRVMRDFEVFVHGVQGPRKARARVQEGVLQFGRRGGAVDRPLR